MYEQTDQLAELIAHKHRVLVNLRDLGARQAELIEQSELDVLLKLLSGKQRLLEELMATDRRLAPFRDQDPAARSWRSEPGRENTSRLAKECERLLLQIVQQEKASERVMTQQRDDTSARLDGAHAAAQAHGAYLAANHPTSNTLDLSQGH